MVRTFRVSLTQKGVVVEQLKIKGSSTTTLLPSIIFDSNGVHLLEQELPDFVPKTMTATIYGIIGVVKLVGGSRCLLVITGFEVIGEITGKQIYRVKNTGMVQLPTFNCQQTSTSPSPSPPLQQLTEEEDRAQRGFIGAIYSFAETHEFFFSDELDLTQSTQRKATQPPEVKELPRWQQADRTFFWNYYLSKPLIESGLDDWITAIIDGYISISHSKAEEQNSFGCVFISRRACLRTGMRYRTRGIDTLGNAANFVETEQLIICNDIISSFVQTRGSVPLMWEQRTQALGAKFVFSDNNKTQDIAFRRHFEQQIQTYGPQFIVNLVDQTGKEAELGDGYERFVSLLNNPRIKYFAFDFHKYCKGNKFQNTQLLLSMVENDLIGVQYFLQSKGHDIAMKQNGVFRTNCVDCLDRTGLVQSIFSRVVMRIQLQQLGLITSRDDLSSIPQLQAHVRNLWADSANYLSTQYTGAKALKTDYTRTGKRSVAGNIMDGVNAVKRIVAQQFLENSKQEEIDIFLGNFVVDKCEPLSEHVDGLFSFDDVILVDRHNGKQKRSVNLRLDKNSEMFSILVIQEYLRKDIPFTSIFDIDKSNVDFRQINVYYEKEPFPINLVFASTLDRQHFLNILYSFIPQLSQSISSPLTQQPLPPTKISLSLVTWNTKWCESPYMAIPLLMRPGAADIYAIALQQCDYITPVGYAMSCISHWKFSVLSFLGYSDYTMVTSSTTEQTSICLFVKRSVVPFIHNAFSCSAKLLPFKLGKVKSTASAVAESPEREKKKGKELPEIVGGAVCIQIHETSLCFINLFFGTLHHWRDNYLHLKTGVEISEINHVFMLGKITESPETIENTPLAKSYVPLCPQQTGSAFSSVLYKPLPGSSLSQIEELSTSDKGNPLYSKDKIPISLSFQITTPPPLKLPETFDVPTTKFLISLTSVKASIHIWDATQQQNYLDAFMLIDAAFLEKAHRTSVCRKTTTPAWSEAIELRSFVHDREYLREQYLRITIWNRGITHDTLVGHGSLELRDAIPYDPNTPPLSKNFNVELTCGDKPSGWLSGSIAISATSQISLLTQQQQQQPKILVTQPLSSLILPEYHNVNTNGTSPSIPPRLSPSPSSSPSNTLQTTPTPTHIPPIPNHPPPPPPPTLQLQQSPKHHNLIDL